MSRKIFPLAALLVFVFALAFSFAAVTQEAVAGPCEQCQALCACHAWNIEWGRYVTPGVCNVFACGHCDDPCF